MHNRKNIHKDNYIEKAKIETTIMGENNIKINNIILGDFVPKLKIKKKFLRGLKF